MSRNLTVLRCINHFKKNMNIVSDCWKPKWLSHHRKKSSLFKNDHSEVTELRETEKANTQRGKQWIPFPIKIFCNTTIFWSDSVPLSEDYVAFLKATISDLDGIAVSKEALGAEAGGGRGVVEIALNRDKGLLSVIQHQPFYSSYSRHTWVWASPGG